MLIYHQFRCTHPRPVSQEVVTISITQDDVIKWEHFPRYWPFVRGIHRSQVNSPHKGQWCGALVFSLSCVWINTWVNNGEAGDLRRYRAHYDVIDMLIWSIHYFDILSHLSGPMGPVSWNKCILLCNKRRDEIFHTNESLIYASTLGSCKTEFRILLKYSRVSVAEASYLYPT